MQIELQEGKEYFTVEGVRIGPMKPWTDIVMHVGDHRRWYRKTGEQMPPYGTGPRQHLVREYTPTHHDAVDHPSHYTSHPSGVECITVVEHMNFCRGNAVKYIWRAGEKDDEIEDLKKARWYLDREIARLEKGP